MRSRCSGIKRNVPWGRQQRHVSGTPTFRRQIVLNFYTCIIIIIIIIIAITTTTSTTATTNTTTTTTTTTSTAKFYCKFYQQLLPTHLCVAIFCQLIQCVHVTTLNYFPLHILAISAPLRAVAISVATASCRSLLHTDAHPSVVPDTLIALHCNLETSNRRWPPRTLVTNSYPQPV
jgi:hypothetical protein